jgi:transposase-like protein
MGGANKNRHANKKVSHDAARAVVLTLVHKETGEVRSQVIPNAQGWTLRDAIAQVADLSATILHTDGWGGYELISWEFMGHETVNHVQGEYVRYTDAGTVTTNPVEGYFSQFKRSVTGTHHNISKEHTGRYVREFDFRANTRKGSDAERATAIVDRTPGAYLSYRRLISTGPVAMGTRQSPPGRPGPR